MMDDQVISIAAGIAVPIVVCLVTSIVSIVSSSNIPGGWLRRTSLMIDVYERAPIGMTMSSDQLLALFTLRDAIYSSIIDGLGFKLEELSDEGSKILKKKLNVRRYLKFLVMSFFISAIVLAVALVLSGIDIVQETVVAVVVFGFACSVSSIVFALAIVSVFGRWPRKHWNLIYMRRVELAELQKSLAVKAREFDEIERNSKFEKAIEASLGRSNRNDSFIY